jgi:signal transduction histidine kinase
MLLSLTHAHLTVVVLVMAALVVFAALTVVTSRDSGLHQPESGGAMAVFADRLFRTATPLVGVWSVMMIVAVAVMLPPSAFVSYLIARRTTQRLERLAETARAIRKGDYRAQVEVVGEDEVAQLQSDFNAMAKELAQALHDLETQRDAVSRLLQSRRQLVANVSHELRTPVATARATLESMRGRSAQDAAPALRHDLEVVEGEILRLQRLIDDLFTLSQVEVDRLAMHCEPIDVSSVVRRMVGAMAPLAWKTGRVEVVAELPSELPPARADESRLEQIVANLVRNAIRHTPPGGIVAVSAHREADAVCVEVRDTGEGILPQDLPHIWERFYRGESAQEDSRGAGLGLALVKELTEAMGGDVEVESVVGQGSRFVVRLPTS